MTMTMETTSSKTPNWWDEPWFKEWEKLSNPKRVMGNEESYEFMKILSIDDGSDHCAVMPPVQ